MQIPNGEECDDSNKVVTDGCVSKSPLPCHTFYILSLLCHIGITEPLHALQQNVNMPSVAMAIAMRVARNVMEKTLATKHAIHTFQGECRRAVINH